MSKIRSYEEFINEIRGIDERLKNAKVKSVEVDKSARSITYLFICDKPIDDALKRKIAEKAMSLTPESFREVFVKTEKIASDDQLVNLAAYDFLKKNYPSVSIFMDESDVSSSLVGNVVKYTLKLPADGADYVMKNGAMKKLDEYLSGRFCSDFVGTTEIKTDVEKVNILSEEVYESELQKIMRRTIKVKDVIPIDDPTLGDSAQYIEDLTSGAVTVCGTVTSIDERTTKNGKPFFIIHIDDTTGRTGGVYFTKKTTYQKIKEIKEGDAIIARATIGDYNGRQSLTFEKINRCTFPEDFKPESKAKKTAPRNYKKIFPEQASTVKVKSVFDEETVLPTELTDKEYVVLDIETTGLENSDEITEIGAVKIRNGRISEQWTTLVKPTKKLTPENVKLTGITEEMLKDAPLPEEIFPDFMKFIDGTVLVAHYADFDLSFIRREAAKEDYEVRNKILDTVIMSRTYVPGLVNNKLNVVADHFGVVFRHHRALSDAYATAEIFIELMKIKAKKEENA